MIWWIIWLVAMASLIFAIKKTSDSGLMAFWAGTGTAGFFVFLGFLIATIVSTYNCANLNVGIKEIRDNGIIFQERYDNQKAFIISYSEKYPMEAKLFKSFNTSILLSLPEIKSDNLLLKSIEKILDIEDDIYNNKIKLNKFKKELRFYKEYRLWSFTLISPKI